MLKYLFLVTCLILNGCMVGPDYKEPCKPIAKHWKINNNTVSENASKKSEWWQVFHDPTLTLLINEGYRGNLTLQSMGVKVLQARAQLAQSVGELYPQQQAIIGNYNYNRIGGGSLQSVLPPSFDTALLGFTANWELDFWGKYRRAIQSNNAIFLSSIAAYDHALVTLTADIASTYIKIRTLESLIVVTKANIEVQAMGLQIAQARYNSGETSQIDVEQATAELTETQSTLPTLYNSLQRQKDTLCVLLGKVPNQLDELLATNRGIPQAPTSVAVGIPKETLVSRPDVYQARMEAIAQSEMIGATKANLFPSLSLVGTFAFASNNIGNNSINDIFQWSQRTITAGPGLNFPILNYGQITNAVRVQDALYQQSLLNYVNLVLKAQQEVQDNISAFIEAKSAEHYLSLADKAATNTLDLIIIRYKEGEMDFTPVLIAEQQQLRIQTSLINAQGDVPQAVVALYRALGGGWEIRQGSDFIPESIKQQMSCRTNWGGLLQQKNHVAPITECQNINQLYIPKW